MPFIKELQKLLDAQADITTIKEFYQEFDYHSGEFSIADESGATALHLAAKHKRSDVAEFHLGYFIYPESKQSIINAKDIEDNTALHIAVVSRNFDLVRLLVENYARLLQDRNGKTPLYYAFRVNHFDSFKLLLPHYIFGTDMPDSKGDTLWHKICTEASKKSEFLLEFMRKHIDHKRALQKNSAGQTAVDILATVCQHDADLKSKLLRFEGPEGNLAHPLLGYLGVLLEDKELLSYDTAWLSAYYYGASSCQEKFLETFIQFAIQHKKLQALRLLLENHNSYLIMIYLENLSISRLKELSSEANVDSEDYIKITLLELCRIKYLFNCALFLLRQSITRKYKFSVEFFKQLADAFGLIDANELLSIGKLAIDLDLMDLLFFVLNRDPLLSMVIISMLHQHAIQVLKYGIAVRLRRFEYDHLLTSGDFSELYNVVMRKSSSDGDSLLEEYVNQLDDLKKEYCLKAIEQCSKFTSFSTALKLATAGIEYDAEIFSKELIRIYQSLFNLTPVELQEKDFFDSSFHLLPSWKEQLFDDCLRLERLSLSSITPLPSLIVHQHYNVTFELCDMIIESDQLDNKLDKKLGEKLKDEARLILFDLVWTGKVELDGAVFDGVIATAELNTINDDMDAAAKVAAQQHNQNILFKRAIQAFQYVADIDHECAAILREKIKLTLAGDGGVVPGRPLPFHPDAFKKFAQYYQANSSNGIRNAIAEQVVLATEKIQHLDSENKALNDEVAALKAKLAASETRLSESRGRIFQRSPAPDCEHDSDQKNDMAHQNYKF